MKDVNNSLFMVVVDLFLEITNPHYLLNFTCSNFCGMYILQDNNLL